MGGGERLDSSDEDPLARLRSTAAGGNDRPTLVERGAAVVERLRADPATRGVAVVSAAATSVVLVLAGVLLWARPGEPPEAASVPLLPFVSTTAPVVDDDPDELVVHVAGAVALPGVYRLASSARVADLVDQAGGLTPDADGERLNLASPLADGIRVYVPRVGEPAPPPVEGIADGHGVAPDGTPGGATIDVNRASAKELEGLPGIGPATSAAIVAHRDAHGPFRSVEDLIDVRGIGPSKLDQIRELVSV